jgi:ABC-type Na+ efflux pump permease subunit
MFLFGIVKKIFFYMMTSKKEKIEIMAMGNVPNCKAIDVIFNQFDGGKKTIFSCENKNIYVTYQIYI